MRTSITRRRFLGQAAGIGALSSFSSALLTFQRGGCHATAAELDLPLIDFHVHLDNSSIGPVLELSTQRQVKFGIVEHAGTQENKYPVLLSNDSELQQYLAMLKDKPVYKGIQAEWIDWMSCFSPEVLGQLDYILSDAMTFPGPNGQRMKLWEKGAEIGGPQKFMDRYAEWHVEIMAKEPLDILANTTWLPTSLLGRYDALWTRDRMQKVIDAAVRYGVALEISSSYQLPKLDFLRMAKEAGVKFSMGSNGRYPSMGSSIITAMAKHWLTRADCRPARPAKTFQAADEAETVYLIRSGPSCQQFKL